MFNQQIVAETLGLFGLQDFKIAARDRFQTDGAAQSQSDCHHIFNCRCCPWNFRSQNRNRGGVLPVLQRARPHLDNALQVRQAQRDLLQVRHWGSAEVWASARASDEEQGRGRDDFDCELFLSHNCTNFNLSLSWDCKTSPLSCSGTGKLGYSLCPEQPQSLHHLRACDQTEGSGQDCGHPAAVQLQGCAERLAGDRLPQRSPAHRNTRPAKRPAQDRRDGKLCLPLCTGEVFLRNKVPL